MDACYKGCASCHIPSRPVAGDRPRSSGVTITPDRAADKASLSPSTGRAAPKVSRDMETVILR